MEGRREAETLYNLLREGRMGARSFLHNAWVLQRHFPEAAEYLLYLLQAPS